MILVTNNILTLNSNINGKLFSKIYIKTNDENIIENSTIKKFPENISDISIINSEENIYVICNSPIIFLNFSINIDTINFNDFFRVNIDDENFYYMAKSPIKFQKLQILPNIFNINIINDGTKYIYINGFWDGYVNLKDGINFKHLFDIFKKTKLSNIKITKDINKANVLLESLFSDTLINYKKWDLTIHYSGESKINNYNYDIIISNENDNLKKIPLSLFSSFIYCNNLSDKLINRKKIEKVPKHFCCFIVSNPNCEARNKIFEKINSYKKVHSYGKYANNMGINITFDYWSDNFQRLISNYKFMICCENTKKDNYITEKIVNPFVSQIIPIYWGADNIIDYFNENSFINIKDYKEECIDKALEKIMELDLDDNKYLEFINNSVIKDINIINVQNDYVANRINNLI